MARQVSWGTPARPPGYQKLRPAFARVRTALLAGAALALAFVVMSFVGARGALMPGSLSSGHTGVVRCEECHRRSGLVGEASDFRCQRCHDPAAAGRLDVRAHAEQLVVAGGRPKRTASLPAGTGCPACHVEHRGGEVRLARVEERRCLECHDVARPAEKGQTHRIASFAAHPEFAVVGRIRASPTSPAGVEAPGLLFTHRQHLDDYLPKRSPGVALGRMCERCHVLDRASREFSPIRFSAHCSSCHEKDLAMADGVPLGFVRLPNGTRAAACGPEADEAGFECAGGRMRKRAVVHHDRWVVQELRRIQLATNPPAYAAERSRLGAEVTRLDRRLALGVPLAGRSADVLQELTRLFEDEIALLDQRARQLGQTAPGGQVATRVDEVARAAAAQGNPEVSAEVATLTALAREVDARPQAGVSDLEARRGEVLELLSTLDAELDRRVRAALGRAGVPRDDAAARAALALKATASELRRRVLAVQPGEDARAAVVRTRTQRALDLERVRDEQRLRADGVAAQARTDPDAASIEASLRRTREALRRLRLVEEAVAPPPDPTQVDALVRALVGEAPRPPDGAGKRCLVCHVLQAGAFAPVRAAEPVLVLAGFVHEPHLTAARLQAGTASPAGSVLAEPTACASCHRRLGGRETDLVQYSNDSRELHVPDVASCRECHRPAGNRQDCLLCHRYHPRSLP